MIETLLVQADTELVTESLFSSVFAFISIVYVIAAFLIGIVLPVSVYRLQKSMRDISAILASIQKELAEANELQRSGGDGHDKT